MSRILNKVAPGSYSLSVEQDKSAVAEIRTPGWEYGQIKRDALKQEWIDSKKLFLPAESPRPLEMMSIHVSAGTAEGLFDFERGEGNEGSLS